MTNKKIVLAGGTGFVGGYLDQQFTDLGCKVIVISRQGKINWQDETSIIEALENSDLLINLAGKTINCRHNEKNKTEILRSRVETTQQLGNALLKCENPPQLFINASGAGIYREAFDRPMTESNGEIGTGFSVEVVKEWEKAFFEFKLPKTRQIALRMAVVFGKNGGAIIPFTNLVAFGLGGTQGKGKQLFTWIHIEDLFNIIQFLQTHTELEGVFNACSPNPIDNKTLMKAFRQAMNVKIGLPSPELILKIGAFLIGTESELLLKSQWVIPERLVNAGYHFNYPTINQALKNLLSHE